MREFEIIMARKTYSELSEIPTFSKSRNSSQIPKQVKVVNTCDVAKTKKIEHTLTATQLVGWLNYDQSFDV